MNSSSFMDDNKINLRATHQGEVIIGDIKLKAYVLENGLRVFSGREIQKALGIKAKSSGNTLEKLLIDKSIAPQIEPALFDLFANRIPFVRKGAGGAAPTTYGYEVVIVPEFCNLILSANDAGLLPSKYEFMVERANILVRSFARVGIIALVDEATGYQLDRAKDELQKILSAYIAEELLPWQKRFPDEFYNQIYRLKGWEAVTRS